jgi:ATP-binding cassette subfamily F protein 3
VHVSFELLRGERMAILGENGTGKTTLLKTLAGRLPPLSGNFETGHDVSIGYYDQELRDLDPRRRAIDAIWDEHPEENEEEMRSYLARFAFRGEEVFAPISGLSGGEKGRLTLAIVMRQRHNLLLLDEPTNHLDLDSREALEESL